MSIRGARRALWGLAMAAIAAAACDDSPAGSVRADGLNHRTVDATQAVDATQDAFPGALGHGRVAKGGRGGRVIAVTTLGDDGPGSLAACVESTGPRICVFRVAGVIRFGQKRLIVRHPFLTIAGQTAPGEGITLAHIGGPDALTPLIVKDSHDIVLRHIRVRTDRRGRNRAGNSAIVIENSRRVMIDHVSTSWALDENIGGYRDTTDLTISWSAFSEGIPTHDKCALLSSDPTAPQRISFVFNLCAHNGDRNPDVNVMPRSCVEILNNLFYNAAREFAEVWESYGGSAVSIVGNQFRAGPDTRVGAFAITRQRVGSKGAAVLHVAGNETDGAVALLAPGTSDILTTMPPCPLTLVPVGATEAAERVLAGAGAWPRDAVDRRIVAEVAARGGRIVSAPGILQPPPPPPPYRDDDRDGMADRWERAHGAAAGTADPWGDADKDGWSNLDEFLDAAHAARLAGTTIQ